MDGQGQLLRFGARSSDTKANNIFNLQALSLTAADQLVMVRDDKATVVGIEVDGNGLASPRPTNAIAGTVPAQGDLSGLGDFSFEGESGQVGVHAVQIKVGQFILRIERAGGMKQFRMGYDWWASLAAMRARGILVVEFMAGHRKDLL